MYWHIGLRCIAHVVGCGLQGFGHIACKGAVVTFMTVCVAKRVSTSL